MPTASAPAVSFFFDPVCPWTWLTSRWLVEVAEAEGFAIGWRTFSLAIVNADSEHIPEQYRGPMKAGLAASRLLEAAIEAGDTGAVGELYTELGRRWHHDDETPSVDTVVEVAGLVGLDAYTDAVADESWDAKLQASIDEAKALAGPDVGSPVLQIGSRGIFGPIVSPAPVGAGALDLWTLTGRLVDAPGFFELKRGRTEGPVFGPRP